jgi:hypothetical protein
MIRKLQAISIVLAVLCFIGSQPVMADSEAIEALKQKAEADLEIAAAKLKMKYLIALEKYQKELAASGDLDGALAVKKETERISESKASLDGTMANNSDAGTGTVPAGGTIVLEGKDARLGNGTTFDKDRNLVKGWSRYGAFATWNLTEMKAGTYQVTLRFRAGNLGGGVVQVRTSRRNDKVSIAGTGSWEEPRTLNLGRIYMAAPEHFTIAALQGRSREMIYVESVVLELAQ